MPLTSGSTDGSNGEQLNDPGQQGYQVGAFIFLTKDVSLTIQDSSFINGTAYQGGAIYVQGNYQRC
jgi:predicted outer membrane repeat protein